jgi:hypothetical protein
MTVIGLDKDDISLLEAKQLKEQILKEQDCQIILYQTNRGFHFQLIFQKEKTQKEGFKIRKKYGDCKERMRLSKLRSKIPHVPTDILFSVKNNIWRRRVW